MFRFFVALCLALLCIACAAAPVFQTQQNGYAVTVTVDEQTLGFRSGTITVHPVDGRTFDPTEVTLTAVMRQHGMLLPPIVLQGRDGVYSYERLEINMVGEWQYQIRVTEIGTTTTVEVPITFE